MPDGGQPRPQTNHPRTTPRPCHASRAQPAASALCPHRRGRRRWSPWRIASCCSMRARLRLGRL